ncbi:glucosamine 6-phosphate N-acetyltransferase-like [Amphiura filiformis]|uniref:glucosamine 6-phosphate N-acetyltransferase-like n=1 Tax=Amphiura filiformis TaxID=82378 RepID=UPI003B21EBEB
MENGLADIKMFDSKLLQELDFERKCKVTFDPVISPSNPGESLVMRPLSLGDYDRGIIQLLGQLTEMGDISREKFTERFNNMKKDGYYYVIVIEDTQTNQVIASATVIMEQKIIRQCSLKGRIEEVVVNENYRGKQLGKLLVSTLILLSEHLGAYKTVLETNEKTIPFYKKIWF